MFKTLFGILLTFAILIGLPVIAYRVAKLHTVHNVTFTVTMLPDRNQAYNANGDKNTYANLVYTDHGTFSNVDSYFPYKQNSSDLYGQLHKDGTYTCEVAGWRVGLLNQYVNLIKCKEL